jgi:hypothetical protein
MDMLRHGGEHQRKRMFMMYKTTGDKVLLGVMVVEFVSDIYG